jgi:hypothetical protein
MSIGAARRGFTLLVIGVSLLPALSMSAALAGTRHRARHDHVATRIVLPPSGHVAGHPTQPSMYEARPGWWISSYDCVSDEGQGRFLPCSSLGAGRR